MGWMMGKIVLVVLLFVSARGDFISDFEYGQMLYNNPRGISCAICHGENGEGKQIVNYKDGNETKIIVGNDIRAVSLDTMEAVIARNHPIMPKYYLTHEEVVAIHNYLRLKNKPTKPTKEKEEPEDFLPPIEEFNTTLGGDMVVE